MDLYFKINLIYLDYTFSEPLIEQTVVKAEKGQEETKALWRIPGVIGCAWERVLKNAWESFCLKKMDCGNAGFLGRIKSKKKKRVKLQRACKWEQKSLQNLCWKRGGSFQGDADELQGHVWKRRHILCMAKIRAQKEAVATTTSEDFCSGEERKNPESRKAVIGRSAMARLSSAHCSQTGTMAGSQHGSHREWRCTSEAQPAWDECDTGFVWLSCLNWCPGAGDYYNNDMAADGISSTAKASRRGQGGVFSMPARVSSRAS